MLRLALRPALGQPSGYARLAILIASRSCHLPLRPAPPDRPRPPPEKAVPLLSWTYEFDPAASDIAAVRFEIQDTDPNAPLLQDLEVAYAILAETGVEAVEPQSIIPPGLYSAAARCAEVLARKFGMQADEEIGDLTITWSDQAKLYHDLAIELRAKAQGMYAPFAGGLTHSFKQAARSDPDRVQPAFRRGQFRNPYSGPGEGDGGGPFGPGGCD